MQPTQQRQKTSIFSQFQNNSDNSVTSKQLEQWLMHMAPTSHASPKFNHHQSNNEWNLMSTSSRYESDGMTFGQRIDTFESANKENFLSRGNLVLVMDEVSKTKPVLSQSKNNHFQSTKQQKLTKSKSYINAMQQLQKRAKTLQQQNTTMRRSLLLLQQQKRSSLQSSMVFQQQIQNKLFKLNQTDKKNQQLKRENKKLRDGRNQQSMKVKLMQKVINQHRHRQKQFQERLDILSKQNQSIRKELEQANALAKSLLVENKQLVVKTQMMQNMKQKSTNSILQKYAKSIERIQQLQLTISEMMNKFSATQMRTKRTIQQKDQKYLTMLESINSVKLEKEQLAMKYNSCLGELEDKRKRLYQCQSLVKQLQCNQIEANRNIHDLKIKIKQTETNNQKYSSDYLKLKLKYNSLKDKVKSLENKLTQHQNQSVKRQVNDNNVQGVQIQEEQDSLQADVENKIDSEQQQNQGATKTQQSTPVQRYNPQQQYDHNNYQQCQQQDQHNNYTRPLSIIKHAKNSQPKIRDEIYNDQPVQFQSKSTSNEKECLENQLQTVQCSKRVYDKDHSGVNTIKVVQSRKKAIEMKQSVKEKTKVNNKVIKQQQGKSHSKDSKNSQSCSITLRHKSPKQKDVKQKQQPTKVFAKQNSIVNESFSRSKSSSVQRKSSKQRKSLSIDSKRQSKHNKSATKQQQQPSSQSRLILDGGSECQNNDQDYLCQSAQPTRYPGNSINERYFYSGEINTRQPYLKNIDSHSFYHTPAQQQSTSAMISQQQSKTQLNKAMLLEYQEQALKLYEQHERLLELSQNEDISSEQKAQILGRIRQVMLMIDHNTEKIFSIKGSVQ